MFHLIKKDLLIQKRSVYLSVLLILLFSFYLTKVGTMGLLLSVLSVTYMLTLGAFAIEEKNDSNKMLVSLPIKRKTIVLSKYLSVPILALFALFINELIHLLVHGFQLPLETIPISPKAALWSILASMLYGSISFPLIFKLGYLKSKMMNFLLFFLLISGGTYLFEKWANRLEMIRFFSRLSGMEMGILVIVPVFLLYFLSYLLSLSFFQKREF